MYLVSGQTFVISPLSVEILTYGLLCRAVSRGTYLQLICQLGHSWTTTSRQISLHWAKSLCVSSSQKSNFTACTSLPLSALTFAVACDSIGWIEAWGAFHNKNVQLRIWNLHVVWWTWLWLIADHSYILFTTDLIIPWCETIWFESQWQYFWTNSELSSHLDWFVLGRTVSRVNRKFCVLVFFWFSQYKKKSFQICYHEILLCLLYVYSWLYFLQPLHHFTMFRDVDEEA